MSKYVAPGFRKTAFTCPLCGVYSNFTWMELYMLSGPGVAGSGAIQAQCSHCKEATLWLGSTELMVWPDNASTAPLANEDMPEEIRKDYDEARGIVARSPRGAATLLRLCIQKLCKHLGELGDNINNDVGNLVKKGLPVKVQQALDIVRVTGNNAVHPGEMQLQEDPRSVELLFELVNIIVENQVSQPKAINALYARLPGGARDAIKKRDGANK